MHTSAERLQLAVDAAGVGLYDFNPRTGDLFWSGPLRALLGVPEAAEPSRALLLELLHPDDREPFVRHVEGVLAADGPARHEIELRIVRPDGKQRWLRDTGQAFREVEDGSWRAVRVVGVVHDITAGKRVEAALRETNRRKDDFLAVLGHELRNPLAPISNGIETLRRSRTRTGSEAALLEIMDRQTRHLGRLVDDLLDVSRIERGKLDLRKRTVTLARVIDQALDSSSFLLRDNGPELLVSQPPEPLAVEGDPVRLAQVVTNLLHNAVKFTPESGHIWLRVDREDGGARISVRDDGAGMAPQVLSHAFDLFEQERDGTAGGLGIGLTLVRQLVEIHGGTVDARSEGPGKGSEFIVRLPLAGGAADPIRSDARAALPPMAAAAPPPVLVVDDNRDVADGLAAMLHSLGCETRVAYAGPAALALLREYPARLVLLDIEMPEMDGYETAQRIRAELPARNLSLVAVTGRADAMDRVLGAGFDHCLIKPPDLEALQRLVDLPAPEETPVPVPAAGGAPAPGAPPQVPGV